MVFVPRNDKAYAMRLALLVGSAYEKNGRVASIPSAEIDEGLIERRLGEADADFKVLRFSAERGLAERIEQRLVAQTEPIRELLVYFSGYSVLSEERGPALLLDGERLGTLSLTRLRNLFLVHAASSCLIVDAAAVVDANQSLPEVVNAIGSTLTLNAPSVSAIVAVRNSAVQDSFGGSAFTGLLLTTLDWLAASRDASEPVDLGGLYTALRSDEGTWKDVPAAGLFGQDPNGFTILPRATAASALSADSELPLPSFESEHAMDAPFGAATIPPEEPSTQPGVTAFEDPDELTPARPANLESALAPLPSFELSDSALGDAPLPSFGVEDGPAPQSAPLPSEDGSGARRVPLAAARGPSSEAPAASRASESADDLLVRELESALGRTRDTSERAAILARLARVLARIGQGERASVLFVEATQRDPLHVEVLTLRAEWAEAARDTANLMHTAEMWIGIAPNDVRALMLLGKAAERAGDVRRSLDARLRVAQHSECSPEERKRALRAAARLVRAEFADFEWAEKLDECARTGAPLDGPEDSGVAVIATEQDSPGLPVALGAAAPQPVEEPAASREVSEPSFRDEFASQPFDDEEDDEDEDEDTSEAFSFDPPTPNQPSEPRLELATVPDREAPAFDQTSPAPDQTSLAPEPATLAPAPASFAPEWATLPPGPTSLVPEPATLAPEPATLVPEPATLVPEPATLAPEPATLAPDPTPIATTLEDGAASPVPELAHPAVPPHSVGRDARRARAREYEHALRQNPRDVALREELILLYRSLDELEAALAHCRDAARVLPTHPTTYRLAHAAFLADGDPDGAWNAASVLECLGEADINESLLVTQHRPEGLLAAQSTLSESEWLNALFGADRDKELAPLLAALGPCAASVGTGFAKYKGRYRAPDPQALQDPEKSTTMLAKTFSWTASMLGVSLPQLYVVTDAARELEVLAVEAPSTLASRALGSGLGLAELAFLWGRHLTRYREDVKVLSFFSAPSELASLLHAALALGGARGVDVRSLDGDEKRLYSALRRELRGPALDRLQASVRGLGMRDLLARAGRELARLELLGVRAGLAVCGDVCAAAELIQRFPLGGRLDTPAQLAELYAFAISREYASLRRRLGVAVAA